MRLEAVVRAPQDAVRVRRVLVALVGVAWLALQHAIGRRPVYDALLEAVEHTSSTTLLHQLVVRNQLRDISGQRLGHNVLELRRRAVLPEVDAVVEVAQPEHVVVVVQELPLLALPEAQLPHDLPVILAPQPQPREASRKVRRREADPRVVLQREADGAAALVAQHVAKPTSLVGRLDVGDPGDQALAHDDRHVDGPQVHLVNGHHARSEVLLDGLQVVRSVGALLHRDGVHVEAQGQPPRDFLRRRRLSLAHIPRGAERVHAVADDFVRLAALGICSSLLGEGAHLAAKPLALVNRGEHEVGPVPVPHP